MGNVGRRLVSDDCRLEIPLPQVDCSGRLFNLSNNFILTQPRNDNKMAGPTTSPEIDPIWHFRHDILNLVSIPIIVGLNINVFLNWDVLTFAFYIKAFILYCFIDTVWLILKPKSVASPTTIFYHHIATIAGLVAVLNVGPEFIIIGAAGGLIEINTFFLIARRNYQSSAILNALFFASWVIIRLFLGPWILYTAINLVQKHYDALNEYPIHLIEAITIVLVTIGLNILNFKWSYDLIVKQFARKESLNKGL